MKGNSSHPLRWGLVLSVGGLMLSLTAAQQHPIARTINALMDSVLTDAQKRLPENALKTLKASHELEVRTFATEPMLQNPTNMDIDERGRVWITEAYNYRPAINGNPTTDKGDRIIILEDTNGDGKADVQKVWYQGPELNAPLGILVLGNKAIVSQSPYVWLFEDTDGDDKADKKTIIFQGIEGEQHDHGMHTFVFGPDGKFYFNFGNEGKQLKDAQGNLIKDPFGNPIQTGNKSKLKQGVAFRCDADFKNVEVLAHNFRNPFELAVDSYGTVWQSDNDDDGNKGVRINYVLEGGNYGYTDEVTGANWPAYRTNMEEEIPYRHWHLNDPGVVPNLLQTGSGSPTGMVIYEGNLLPEVYRNQMIHAEPGHNVVRSYPVKADGAGYSASIENILKNEGDSWFRPADVCIAPDGSILIADWYDPGVGGHQAGDQTRGRVYRVAPQGRPYTAPSYNYEDPNSALAALQSPNMSIRYKAWNALMHMGDEAVPALTKLWHSDGNPRMRARAFWILSKMKGNAVIEEALNDANPNLRIAGLRAARQQKADIIPFIKKLSADTSAQVRRECAIALRHQTSPEAAELWANLAEKYDGQDRWYLEALGVGADEQWDSYFAAYLKRHPNPVETKAERDLVWRARTEKASPFLAKLAADDRLSLSKERLRYFRAFDFNTGKAKSDALMKLLIGNNPRQAELTRLALRHLDPEFVKATPAAKSVLKKLMATLSQQEYLEYEARYALPEENGKLLAIALNPDNEHIGSTAMNLLLQQGGGKTVRAILAGKDEDKTRKTLAALRRVGKKESIEIMEQLALSKSQPQWLRQLATRNLGGSMLGEDRILILLREGKIEKPYILYAVQGVATAWRKAIPKEAATYLGGETSVGKPIPKIEEMVSLSGDVQRGVKVFAQNCAVCHQINGQGADFGPKLSEIGSKLPKEGQYMAILYPSAGISFGFEGWNVQLKDGTNLVGIVASKTESDLDLKYPGGTAQRLKMTQVKSMKQQQDSMMPAGLHENMSKQELADLVEYLMTLKKK
ncbi:PVC-type heme-binding CxxCH protein [Siphonobacter sp. SORGH_AS_1065]|nr:PVC-type heme-binding CxxCH protein [Siphonobacter sp. SORGH_AS_1065]MDQ1086248.1 putative membrane-bound dehydrogenase-like protein [Siphonobacter sp. SORGH_AS_1065]